MIAGLGFAQPAYAADWTFGLGGLVAGLIGSSDRDDKEGDDLELGADAEISIFASTLFDSGLEVQLSAEAGYDEEQEPRAWAGGRLSGNLVGGRGAAFGADSDFFLTEARISAMGGFGEVLFGRDDGVADMLAITAPNIFSALTINDWDTDVTGLIDVHTVNDFSGYATKGTYITPLFSGAQLGVSYTPELNNCFERACFTPVRAYLAQSDPRLSLAAQTNWEDILEVALYYEHVFSNGVEMGLTGAYVSAQETSGALDALFDDYEAYSLGANLAFGGFTVGGSYRNSNGGYLSPDDNYVAFDAGLTYETGPWGFMVGYGNSDAGHDAANPLNTALFRQTRAYQTGVTYMLGAGISVGLAGQFVQADKSPLIGGDEEAAAIVFESSINF